MLCLKPLMNFTCLLSQSTRTVGSTVSFMSMIGYHVSRYLPPLPCYDDDDGRRRHHHHHHIVTSSAHVQHLEHTLQYSKAITTVKVKVKLSLCFF
jgi:hypothetical protein